MVVLSVDTAANMCAVAINDEKSGKLLSSISRDIGRGHAELLMGIIDECMNLSGVGYDDVGKIITSIGPGSFTGVRVGISAARAIGLGLSKPVAGVSNLQACAQYALQIGNSRHRDTNVSVILDARRNEVYFQQFQIGNPDEKPIVEPMDDPKVCQLDDLVNDFDNLHAGAFIYCGSGAKALRNKLATSNTDIQFEIVHPLATAPIEIFAMLGMAAQLEKSHPEPLYLRSPDAKKQKGFAVRQQGFRNGKTV